MNCASIFLKFWMTFNLIEIEHDPFWKMIKPCSSTHCSTPINANLDLQCIQIQLSDLWGKNPWKLQDKLNYSYKGKDCLLTSIKSNNIGNQMMYKRNWKTSRKCHGVKVDAIKTYRFPFTISHQEHTTLLKRTEKLTSKRV